MGRACSTYGEKRNAYNIFVGKPERKRPLGKPRRRWEDGVWKRLMWLRIQTGGGL
jgi:hypothetical protein